MKTRTPASRERRPRRRPVPDGRFRVDDTRTTQSLETPATAFRPAAADPGDPMRYDACSGRCILHRDVGTVANDADTIRIAMGEGEQRRRPRAPVRIR